MNCDRAKELFSDLHEGSLKGGLQQAAQRHVRECPACEHEFKLFQAAFQSLAGWPEIAPPDDLSERIARSLDKADWERKQSAPVRFKWLRLGAFAAAAAVIGFLVYNGIARSKHGIEANPIGISVPTDAGVDVKVLSGKVRLQYFPTSSSVVAVWQGGADYSTLPPSDAILLRRDKVAAMARYDVPLSLTAAGPDVLWVQVEGSEFVTAVFFPQGSASAGPSTVSSALRKLASESGKVVEARLRTPDLGKGLRSAAGVESVGMSVSESDGVFHVR